MADQMQEGTLVTPVFTSANDDMNQQALQTWASFVSMLSGINYLDADCQMIILQSLAAECMRRSQELADKTQPPVPTPITYSNPSLATANTVAQDVPAEMMPVVDLSIATESKEIDPTVKRLRELAGIPHKGNWV